MRSPFTTLAPAFALVLYGVGACAAEPAIEARSLTLAELDAHLAPAAGEKAVLVNFWATW